jgi:hypothetical protein
VSTVEFRAHGFRTTRCTAACRVCRCAAAGVAVAHAGSTSHASRPALSTRSSSAVRAGCRVNLRVLAKFNKC